MPRIFSSRFLTALLISALIVPCLLASPVVATDYPYSSSDGPIADALNYLRSQQDSTGMIDSFGNSAWVVMSMSSIWTALKTRTVVPTSTTTRMG